MRLIDVMYAKIWARNNIANLVERYAMFDFLESQPTVDAVPVVRCKDCKYAKELGELDKKIYLPVCLTCTNIDASMDGYNIVWPDHYCSYGERPAEYYDIRPDDDGRLLPNPYACWIALDRLPVLPGLYAILCCGPDGRQWLRCAYYDGTRESLGENAVAYASTHPRIVYRPSAEDAN